MPTTDRSRRHSALPRYIIDLSLPPRERYKKLASKYRTQLQDLTGLFNNLFVIDMKLSSSLMPIITRFSKLILRKLNSQEQTEELRGIHEETGIAMYLLVAFNVILDLLMGCTSGGARTLEPGLSQAQAKMLHFRLLDWTMDPLRKVIVQIDFVRSASSRPAEVLASSITYVGFVGVLTGVRQGLSMSLNFRPIHNATSPWGHSRFYFHHLLVLMGRRPSIASLLRQYLIDEPGKQHESLLDPVEVAYDLRPRHTTAAYVILCDGRKTVTMEKDYATAHVQTSSSFIAMTNHDKTGDGGMIGTSSGIDATKGAMLRQSVTAAEIIEESEDRLDCIQRKWHNRERQAWRANESDRHTRAVTSNQASNVCITKHQLIRWVCSYPTTNECTHFAAILDPSSGEVVWSRAYPRPIC